MLLRQITLHIKEQNWFAVCLDFLIVVVGIFIGMQVSNWQDNLKQQSEAIELLHETTEELQTQRNAFKSLSETLSERIPKIEQVSLDLLECSTASKADKGLDDALNKYLISNFALSLINKNTQNISTIVINGLYSDEFMQAIRDYAVRAESRTSVIKNNMMKFWQHHIRENPHIIIVKSEYPENPIEQKTKYGARLTELCKDNSAIKSFHLMTIMMLANKASYDRQVERIDKLIETINNELKLLNGNL